MSDVFTWSHLGVLVALASVCLAIWKLRAADLREIDRKLQSNTIDLAAFKLLVSERHPTIGDLASIETRLAASLDRLSDRIDRLLEREGR